MMQLNSNQIAEIIPHRYPLAHLPTSPSTMRSTRAKG